MFSNNCVMRLQSQSETGISSYLEMVFQQITKWKQVPAVSIKGEAMWHQLSIVRPMPSAVSLCSWEMHSWPSNQFWEYYICKYRWGCRPLKKVNNVRFILVLKSACKQNLPCFTPDLLAVLLYNISHHYRKTLRQGWVIPSHVFVFQTLHHT